MKIFASIVLSLLVTVGFSQVRPDQFLEQTNPTNANFEFYSQKGGAPRRATWDNVRKRMVPDAADTVAFIPAATGNTTNLGNFVYDSLGALWYIDGLGDAINFSTTGADVSFDSDRPILRVPDVGDVIGGSSVTDWLEWWYFVAPTISISAMSSPVEVGTTNTYNVSGTTTNTGGATLSAGYFRQTSPSTDTLVSFGSATSYADTIVFTPQQGGSGQFNALTYTFQAKQSWVFGSESGTATSTARTVTGVYPVFYGMSSTDFSDTGTYPGLALGTAAYSAFTKLVQAEGDKSVTLTGTGYIYYFVPKTWSDFTLSQIIDHNGFNVTPSFTSYDVTISSTGLTNDYINVAYKMYKLNTTTTTSGYEYDFNR